MTVYSAEETMQWFTAHRDPGEIIADLHEAIRKDRVLHLVTNQDVSKQIITRKLPPMFKRRAIYDVDAMQLRIDSDEAFRKQMLSKGCDLAEEGHLVADSTALMFALLIEPAPRSQDDWFWSEFVVCIDPATAQDNEMHEGWVAHHFEREHKIPSRQPVRYGTRGFVWTCRRVLLLPQGWLVEYAPNDYRKIETIGWAEADVHTYHRLFQTYMLSLCGMLASEPEYVDAPPSAPFDNMNRGRSRAKLPPVPPIQRMLDISRKVYLSSSEHQPTGRQMPKHFRRATFRTYRAERYVNVRGQQRPVRSAIVRGDREGDLDPIIYEVIGKLPN